MRLSSRHLSFFKISKREKNNEQAMIEDMRARIKTDPAVIAKFKKYDVPIDELDNVHIEFTELDVSAKTKDKKIYLNRKMLEPESDVDDPTHYVVHEIVHFLQQLVGDTSGHNETDDYLHKETEQAAFSVQYDFKKRNEGKEEADTYVEDLLSHHDKSGKERSELRKEIKEPS